MGDDGRALHTQPKKEPTGDEHGSHTPAFGSRIFQGGGNRYGNVWPSRERVWEGCVYPFPHPVQKLLPLLWRSWLYAYI